MKERVCVPLLIGTVLLNVCVWFSLHRTTHELFVSFLNVGQGDAILIESPTGTQLLIDGGRDQSVLRELGKRMSPFDRSIDLVLETHPDADHIGGLPSVFDRYTVGGFLLPGVDADTNPAKALDAAVHEETGVQEYELRRGDRIHLGGGAYLDILFPDRDVSTIERNTGSMIARLVYGDTSFMLTGDSPQVIEEYLVALDGDTLESDVLKAGHHGSRTSTSDAFLEAVAPGAVVISAGESNSYGHPHPEVVAKIEASGARLFTTIEEGAVVFESDGKVVRHK
jgi:competence protein ComEC